MFYWWRTHSALIRACAQIFHRQFSIDIDCSNTTDLSKSSRWIDLRNSIWFWACISFCIAQIVYWYFFVTQSCSEKSHTSTFVLRFAVWRPSQPTVTMGSISLFLPLFRVWVSVRLDWMFISTRIISIKQIYWVIRKTRKKP